MGRKLVLAVAGAGKTASIINAAAPEKRTAIITYTNENLRSLQSRLVEKHGRLPESIHISSYFSFLYSFCYRPFCHYEVRDAGYGWGLEPPMYAAKTQIEHYRSPRKYLYPSRVSKLLMEFEFMPKVHTRLAEHFDQLLIDEVQDFSANDFNFILQLSEAPVDCLYVGDYYQHTYDTSRDGNTRSGLHKKGVENFVKQFAKFEIDRSSLARSYRCSPSVCELVTKVLGLNISSHRSDLTAIEIVEDPKRAMTIFRDGEIVKLFLKEHDKYNCFSNNWGASKGRDDYDKVCVVVNEAVLEAFKAGTLADLNELTRNKLYVACTRARGELFIVPSRHFKSEKAKG